MAKRIIKMTDNSGKHPPGMLRPYSAAIQAGDFIFVSGFHGGGRNPQTGEEYNTIELQTHECLEHIKSALEAGGASLADAVKVTVFIDSAAHFEAMNTVYARYFPAEPPVRSCVVSGFIRPGMMIQIDCIAYHPE